MGDNGTRGPGAPSLRRPWAPAPGPSLTPAHSPEPQAQNPPFTPGQARSQGRHKIQSEAASPGSLCRRGPGSPLGKHLCPRRPAPSQDACPQDMCWGLYTSACMTLAIHPRALSSRCTGRKPRTSVASRAPRDETHTRGEKPGEERGPSLEPLQQGWGGSQLPAQNTGPSEAAEQGLGRLSGPSPHNPGFVPSPSPAQPPSCPESEAAGQPAPLEQGLGQLGHPWPGPGLRAQLTEASLDLPPGAGTHQPHAGDSGADLAWHQGGSADLPHAR